MGPLEIIGVWVLFSALVGGVAAQRGRNNVGWFLVALLLSPLLALIFLAVLPDLRTERAAAAAEVERRHQEQLDAIAGNKLALPPAPVEPDVMRTIGSLAELRDAGAITADEYEAKKRDLLARV